MEHLNLHYMHGVEYYNKTNLLHGQRSFLVQSLLSWQVQFVQTYFKPRETKNPTSTINSAYLYKTPSKSNCKNFTKHAQSVSSVDK